MFYNGHLSIDILNKFRDCFGFSVSVEDKGCNTGHSLRDGERMIAFSDTEKCTCHCTCVGEPENPVCME